MLIFYLVVCVGPDFSWIQEFEESQVLVSEEFRDKEIAVVQERFESLQDFYVLDKNRTIQAIVSLDLVGVTSSKVKRPNIDLVLVIDVSGSMAGDKIKLVQKSLFFILTQVQENDQISIITFNEIAKILCGLTRTNEEGKKKLSTFIDSLTAVGGTNIVGGLQLGLGVLRDRKIINTSSAIIILTDGNDDKKDTSIKRSIDAIKSVNIIGQYAIHTFGYGKDHDAQLLNSISDFKSGGFYYIEHLNDIPEAFANCLGEIMSVLFDSIQVNIVTQESSVPFRLKKVFSDSGDNSFTVTSLIRGIKKEILFIIDLDYCEFPQDQIEIQPVKAFINYRDVKTEERQVSEVILTLRIKKEGLPTINLGCLTNYYRFRTAQAIKEADELAMGNQLVKARSVIQTCIDEILNVIIAESQLGKVFVEDLKKAIKNLGDLNLYHRGGQIANMEMYRNHLNKRGKNIDAYQNPQQKEILKSINDFFS